MTTRLASILPMCLLALGCGGRRGGLPASDAGPGPTDAPAGDRVAPPPDTSLPACTTTIDSLDLLFMVDNSNTMDLEQQSMAQQLPRLIRALATGDHDDDGEAELTAVTRLNVGVVNSDMGTGGHPIDTCSQPGLGDDGILQETGNPDIPGCMAFYPRFLGYSPLGDSGTAAQDVACLSVVGIGGCGFEQPLEAVLKAVTPSTSSIAFPAGGAGHADGENSGFLRPDSALAIVMLTDEEDCSASDPNLYEEFSETYEGSLNLRCFSHPDALQPVQRFVDGLLATRTDPRRLSFSVIAGVPGELGESSYEEILSHPGMQEVVDTSMPDRLAPSCDVPGRGITFPPRRLVQVAAGLRDRGAQTSVRSICSADLSFAFDGVLASIGDALECR